jgi:hypothetical protein
MNNCCICWFFTHIITGDFNFKGLNARRLYKSFGVKGLNKTDKIQFLWNTALLTKRHVVISQRLECLIGSL